jgi:hypothetical protein
MKADSVLFMTRRLSSPAIAVITALGYRVGCVMTGWRG